MELDLWIPIHRIGIEYQGIFRMRFLSWITDYSYELGEQHYYNMSVFGPSNASAAYSERDTVKNNLCETQGITLIAIPYWYKSIN